MMSNDTDDVCDADGAAPLDLRVKKEVKEKPLLSDNIPLNLSNPPTSVVPPPTRTIYKEISKDVRNCSVSDVPNKTFGSIHPYVVQGIVVSKSTADLPTASKQHMHPMVAPRVDASVVSGQITSISPKLNSAQITEACHAPREITFQGTVADTISGQRPLGNTEKMLVTVAHSNAEQSGIVTPPTPIPLQVGTQPSPRTTKQNILSPPQHHVKHQSPDLCAKIKSSTGIPNILDNTKPPAVSVAKLSPTPKVHSKRTSKPSHSLHSISTPQVSVDRLVSHVGSPPRSAPQLSGPSQTASYQVHGVPLSLETTSARPPREPNTRTSNVPQVHELLSRPVQQRIPGSQPQTPHVHTSTQHAVPPRAAAQSHSPSPPVEGLLRLRHPVPVGSLPDGNSPHPRATHAPNVLAPSNQALPTPHTVLSHSTVPSHPSSLQGASPLPNPSPQPSASHPVPSHPLPTSLQETPHERALHSGAGQGYISPSREYYPMGSHLPGPSSTVIPQGHLPTSGTQTSLPPVAASLVQTPGSASSHGPRYPSAPSFTINPFVSLSIAIDCQRATEQDSDGDTALHIAIVQDKPDMGLIRRLIELVRLAGKSVDIFNYMQQTPLHLACIMKDSDIIRLLVEAGANPNEADRNGQTAPHHACKNGSPGCLGAILRYSQSDVDLNIRNYEGYTPLHLAAMIGSPTLVTMLLEKGADLNSKDSKNGWTPLFHAVTNQDTKLVHKMVSSGAEVNIQSYSGNTVLHVATGRGYTDIVKILVHYGADMSLKNMQWDTPATITTDKMMSTLLRGLGAGSPQTVEASVPCAPNSLSTLPIPINDAYLIKPTTIAISNASSAIARSPMVTTKTTERLKGSANEVYTVTRSVTRQDSAGATPTARSPDGQRAIHKQTQERLRHSIQYRKVVNELRSESQQRKSEGVSVGSNSEKEKVVVVVPAKVDKEGRISVIVPSEEKESDFTCSTSERTAFLSELEKKVNAVKAKEGVGNLHHGSPLNVNHPTNARLSSKSTAQDPTSSSDINVHAGTAVLPNVALKIEDVKSTAECAYSARKGPSATQVLINMNGHLRTLPVNVSTDSNNPLNNVENSPPLKELKHELILNEGKLSKAEGAAPINRGAHAIITPVLHNVPTTVESENELRARMLSLQYKNSDAFLGGRYERKLEHVGSDQEREAASAILAMGRSAWQRQRSQTCDADSTVKTEPVSPNPVLSSTSDSAPMRSLSPPVLEREGDEPPRALKNVDPDDEEPSLIIDESCQVDSKSRKKSRVPTKPIPHLSPAKSSDYVETSSDSLKLGKLKVTGDPKKLWKKKALATMAESEPKKKRKKSERSSKDT